jgi:hypothetical protein
MGILAVMFAIFRSSLLSTAIILLTAQTTLAERDIRTERVQFKPGATSAVVEDSITGYQTVDYVLGAREGQSMNVSMATNIGANYFNILAPGETEVAMFIGSTSGNQYEGILPESGDYTIRVYLMRSAARRNETADYRLEMIVASGENQASAAAGGGDEVGSNSATRAGQGNFDATGKIPCAQQAGQLLGQCDYGVSREGSGTATVIVTKPDGRTRALFFIKGEFNSADTSQADGYPEYSAEREGDLIRVTVGDERYEIPDAVIQGG